MTKILENQSKADIEEVVDGKPVGIRIQNLNQFYGKAHILKNLSIDFFQDEITALLGANGAGKTVRVSVYVLYVVLILE